jgi:hypothetical protein
VHQAIAKRQANQRWWSDPLSAPLSSVARKVIVAATLDRNVQ